MNTFSRGVRNAFRNGIRTVAIVLILGLSIGLSLAMLLAGQAVDKKIDQVKSSVGNTITVNPAGVRGFEGGGTALTDSQVTQVKNLAHVSGVTSTLSDRLSSDNTNLESAVEAGGIGERFQGENNSNSSSQTSQNMPQMPNDSDGTTREIKIPLTVIGTTGPSNVSEIGAVTLSSGEMIDADSSANEALIGQGLADKNELKVGDAFTAYGQSVTVSGIIDTSENRFAGNMIVMPIATLQNLSDQSGTVNAMIVTADSIDNADAVVSEITNALGSSTVDVTSAKDQAESAVEPLESIKNISTFSLIAAVVAGGIIILLAMIMIVRERRREIGALKAIGATNKTVTMQFVVESLTLTLIASIVGIVIGIAAANPLTKMLVNNAESSSQTSQQGPGQGGPGGGQRRMNFATRGVENVKDITANINWTVVAYGLGAALVIAAIGSAAASMIITKVRPAEAVRSE